MRAQPTAASTAAILATAIGPGLLLTGSVATLICRRIARDAGAALSAVQLTSGGPAIRRPPVIAAAARGGRGRSGRR
jgi:Na+/H+ antiporter NhaD/arsenite permease-like protein